MEKNTLNLQFGAFLSAKENITLVPLTTPMAFKLMNATGSKIADKQLKLVGDDKFYVASIVDPNGQQVWAMVPIDYPLIKWNGNTCWALLKPEATTLSEAEFNAL